MIFVEFFSVQGKYTSKRHNQKHIHCLQKVLTHLALYGVKLFKIQGVWAGLGQTLKLEKQGHFLLCPWHYLCQFSTTTIKVKIFV